ncbi:MAG: porin [Cyclobacteriaceae bacterium]|nr:porin [Cyclobacteriaceae bacterium]
MRKFYLIGILFLMSFTTYGQQASETTEDFPPGWWHIPKTKSILKFGGYVKFDLIHDFNPIASPDFFDVTKIPTDGSEGRSSNLNAKETRLYLDVKSPSKVGEIRTYVEGDFYGSGGAFRLRHAFVEIDGKWLAGQWWSTFMDENIIPNTLDFEKPGAYAFARHPMLRYKHSFSTDAYFAIAVEQSSINAQAPAQAGNFENPLPDLTARYRITKPWGHVQLSGYAGKLVYRFTNGDTDEVNLFGANFSGQLNFNSLKDRFFYQVLYGPGVGRTRGGLSAAIDENGNLKALTDSGFTLGVDHRWNDSFSSVVVYNQGQVNNLAGQPGTAVQAVNYAAANLLWHFAEHAMAGVEYLWGLRKDFNDADGRANRLQFSVKYVFN